MSSNFKTGDKVIITKACLCSHSGCIMNEKYNSKEIGKIKIIQDSAYIVIFADRNCIQVNASELKIFKKEDNHRICKNK